MSRGRHAKPSSLPSASTTLAAAAPAASAGLSPSGTAHGLRMQVARASAHPSWVMATVQVRSGDSLSTLARRYYHHTAWWPRIWWANRHQVANPNAIRPGEAFIIPVPRAPRPSTVVGALHAIPPAPPPPPAP